MLNIESLNLQDIREMIIQTTKYCT